MSIIKVTWEDIRDEIGKLNKKLTSIIDNISPSKKFFFYRVKYPFGKLIVNAGKFSLPNSEGSFVPISDPSISTEIRNAFKYADDGLPAGIVLKNSYELYIETPKYIRPILITKPGNLFSLWKQLEQEPYYHPIKLFNVTSGARFMFMLPEVSDNTFHQRLKRDYHILLPPPKNFLDQWEIFKALYEHNNKPWHTELLLIPGQWIATAKKDPAWRELYIYLLESAWRSSSYERNRMFYDFSVSCAVANKNLKPDPYLTDTVTHLLMIALGSGIGFTPAVDEQCGPIKLIQEAYVSSYGLKTYTPTVMHPAHFDILNPEFPIYYSLQLPTTIEFSPKSRKSATTLNDLIEIKHIANAFLNETLNKKLNIEDTIIGKLAENIKLSYFHSKIDKFGESQPSKLIRHNKRFSKSLLSKSGKKFAHNGTFLRGCIEIYAKNTSSTT